ncbi:hypothetical protein BU23DRAFT_567778 [Bimuria novae-zelandiae CBS 107.79]|uniref:Uncharacterized protein n=1 Tax=Bimuria novae-zelandiae CBS 107.79 TaxID=1447943 RepID=A0A6A5V9U7_9PLEO|nr:hypothetical protein BU23DRAFT_567778 [Bimuria novae-zelandiae CBS 107.79]
MTNTRGAPEPPRLFRTRFWRLPRFPLLPPPPRGVAAPRPSPSGGAIPFAAAAPIMELALELVSRRLEREEPQPQPQPFWRLVLGRVLASFGAAARFFGTWLRWLFRITR